MEMTFRYRFEAAHRFLGSSSAKCQTPHGHTWWLTVSLARADQNLNEDGMIAEFAQVKGWLKSWVDETLDHSYLYNWKDPVAAVMKSEISGFRGLPFPEDPTTEWAVYLFARKIRAYLKSESDREPYKNLELRSVKVEETPTNSVVWKSEFGGTLDQLLSERLAQYRGWWDEADPEHRLLEPVKS